MKTIHHTVSASVLITLLTGCSYLSSAYFPQPASSTPTTTVASTSASSTAAPVASAAPKLKIAPKTPVGMLDLRAVLGDGASSDDLPIFGPVGNDLVTVSKSTTAQELATTFHFKGADNVSRLGVSHSVVSLPGPGGAWVDCPIEFLFNEQKKVSHIDVSIPAKVAPAGFDDYAAHFAAFRFGDVGSMNYATKTMKVYLHADTSPAGGYVISFEVKDVAAGSVANAQNDRRGPLSAR